MASTRDWTRQLFFKALVRFAPLRARVEITYIDKKDRLTRRWVRPLALSARVRRCSEGHVHVGPLKVVCWCEMRKAQREFFPSEMRVHSVRWIG